jgi:hypothetical protein
MRTAAKETTTNGSTQTKEEMMSMGIAPHIQFKGMTGFPIARK